MSKTITYEEHEKAIDQLRSEYDKTIEDNHEESYKMVSDIQKELSMERAKADMFRAIAYLEKTYMMPELSDFQGQLRQIVETLWKRADKLKGENKKETPEYTIHWPSTDSTRVYGTSSVTVNTSSKVSTSTGTPAAVWYTSTVN